MNAKRQKKERLRANGDEAYKEWLHDQPCAFCGWRGKPEQMQEMHVKGGGVGRKADVVFTIPACGPHFVALGIRIFGRDWNQLVEGCHAASHRGQKTFEKTHGVNLLALAAITQAKYEMFCGRVVHRERERDMTEDSVLETLRRVPDRIILATMGRDLDLNSSNRCLCGWFVREKLAEISNVGASTTNVWDATGTGPITQAVRHFGGTREEWSEIFHGVEYRNETTLLPIIEAAFVRRVEEAVFPPRRPRRSRKARPLSSGEPVSQ